jgi:hypothetical protein
MPPFYSNLLWWVIVIANIGIVFLMMLNGYLRGTYRHHIDAALSVFFLAILVTVVVVYNWLLLLAHIIGSFIVGAIFQGLTARIASRLLRQSTPE